MSKLKLLSLMLIPLGASASSDTIDGIKINEKTTVYGNGLASTLLIGYFSQYNNPEIIIDETELKNERKRNGEMKELYELAMESERIKGDEIKELYDVAVKEGQVRAGNLSQRDSEVAELKRQLQGKLSLGDLTQNLYYPTSGWELTPDQLSVISSIFTAISGMDDVKVEITGRADPRGKSDYNLKLSEKRAEFIHLLAVESGVNAESVTSIGVGETGEIRSNSEMNFFDRFSTVKISLLNEGE